MCNAIYYYIMILLCEFVFLGFLRHGFVFDTLFKANANMTKEKICLQLLNMNYYYYYNTGKRI
jgi:hypothetical protein